MQGLHFQIDWRVLKSPFFMILMALMHVFTVLTVNVCSWHYFLKGSFYCEEYCSCLVYVILLKGKTLIQVSKNLWISLQRDWAKTRILRVIYFHNLTNKLSEKSFKQRIQEISLFLLLNSKYRPRFWFKAVFINNMSLLSVKSMM